MSLILRTNDPSIIFQNTAHTRYDRTYRLVDLGKGRQPPVGCFSLRFSHRTTITISGNRMYLFYYSTVSYVLCSLPAWRNYCTYSTLVSLGSPNCTEGTSFSLVKDPNPAFLETYYFLIDFAGQNAPGAAVREINHKPQLSLQSQTHEASNTTSSSREVG